MLSFTLNDQFLRKVFILLSTHSLAPVESLIHNTLENGTTTLHDASKPHCNVIENSRTLLQSLASTNFPKKINLSSIVLDGWNDSYLNLSLSLKYSQESLAKSRAWKTQSDRSKKSLMENGTTSQSKHLCTSDQLNRLKSRLRRWNKKGRYKLKSYKKHHGNHHI